MDLPGTSVVYPPVTVQPGSGIGYEPAALRYIWPTCGRPAAVRVVVWEVAVLRSRRNALVVTALTGLALGTPLVAAAPALGAPAQHISKCTGQDKVLIKRVYHVVQSFYPTDSAAIDIAPGERFHRKVTLEKAKRLTAKTNYSAEVNGSAGWAFASISVQVKGSVAKEGSTTSKKVISEDETFAAKKYARTIVIYNGWTSIAARWHYLSCSRAPGIGVNKTGYIDTYRENHSGVALCPSSRYKKGTPAYVATADAGC